MDEKRAPENTAKTAKRDSGLLAAMMILGSDTVIKQQEADGQQDFVASTTLPTKMEPEARQGLEAGGVKFLEGVADDSLFQYVELPEGWQKVQRNEYWSDLVDHQGSVRANIFYKAAFYDRSAHLSLVSQSSTCQVETVRWKILPVEPHPSGCGLFYSRAPSFSSM